MKLLDKTISQMTMPTPFPVGDVHVYLLKGDTLSLVDAGVKTKEAWEALTIQLNELGYGPEDIEQVILTHHHPDHMGLVDKFPRLKDIVAHQDVDLWLRRDPVYFEHYEQFFYEFFLQCGIPSEFLAELNKLKTPLKYIGEGHLTGIIQEGHTLPGHEEWRVIETAGHAQSHLSFLREQDGAFIGGDHLLEHISPNPLLEPPRIGETSRSKPMLQYRKNLLKCLDLDIRKVFPGHGKIFTDTAGMIPVRLEKQEQRAGKVHSLLEAKPQTVFELCRQIFPRQYEKQLDLTISETVGQLDFLEDENRVEKTLRDGVFYYHAK
ncbi:MBL fold metallo-hydrolase [Virgibacillus kekensis]|uniref:MBL fold metallo-hydrolase n=1 Tax=Virgibacillus kekensis TaxID=202261 RepID=A0ABV9DL52_9BACI